MYIISELNTRKTSISSTLLSYLYGGSLKITLIVPLNKLDLEISVFEISKNLL